MSKHVSAANSDQPLEERKQRFQVVQLEERIAPTEWAGGLGGYYYYYSGNGHYNPHGKWVGGGRRGRAAY